MANRVFAVLLHVNEDQLGTVLSTLSGSSTLVSVTPTEKVTKQWAPKAKQEPKSSFWTGGVRHKGITGEALVLQVMQSENRIWDSTELRSKFLQNNFAGNSAYSTLSKMASEKKIRSLGKGKFCLPGYTIHLGN